MGRGTNQIATIGNLQEDFGVFSSSTTPNLCPTYAEIIAEGLIVSTTLSNNRLVKYSLISAAVTPPSDTITVHITNLQEITEYYGSNGLDGYTYFRWSDGSQIDDDDLTYNLYCFDGDCYNTVTGTLSQWENFYNSIYGTDDCYLWNSDYDDTIAGPLGEIDCEALWASIQEAVNNGDSECDFEFPFDSSPSVSPSVSPSSLSFSADGGQQSVTLRNGVLTSSSESLSWITLSGINTGSTSVTITASANTSTTSRSGYVDLYVDGVKRSVYVYQSGASSKSCTFEVVETGWLNGRNQSFDLQLSATVGSKTICSYKSINNGYDFGGTGDKTTELNTINVLNGEAFKLWANVMTANGGGTWRVVVYSTGEILGSGSIADDLDSSSTSPALNIQLYSKIKNGDKVTLYLEADS